MGPSRGPRQGRDMRQCIVRRELLPRQLLFRVVRTKTQASKPGAPHPASRPRDDDHSPAHRGGNRRHAGNNLVGNGTPNVRVGSGNGRSAYISKELSCVMEATRKNRLSKALRCRIPPQVTAELRRQAHEWNQLPNENKGLFFCEVYNLDGALSPTEQVQHCMISNIHDIAEDLALLE